MRKIKIGIIDYKSGNQSSLLYSLRKLGFNSFISNDKLHLGSSDLLILPGVGAFPDAMRSIEEYKLRDFICNWSKSNKPLIGICLGMQLLTEASSEFNYTKGLGLIDGECIEFNEPKYHIGWNTFNTIKVSSYMEKYDNQNFYFNHSFFYKGPKKYQLSVTNFNGEFPSIIHSNNIIGLQFHPEKSQDIGEDLLKKIIYKLSNA